MKIYRYSTESRSYVLIDGRNTDISHYAHHSYVRTICAINGTDGLVILEDDPECDFKLSCFGSDGRPAGLEGEAGRCATAFAELLNILPLNGKYGGKGSDGVCEYRFRAADGLHRAWISAHLGELKNVGVEMPGNDGVTVKDEGAVLCEGDLMD